MSFEKIAILGGGNLGSSIAQGIISAGITQANHIKVTRRRVHLLDKLKEIGIVVMAENDKAVKDASLIILAVKPHQINSLLAEVAEHIVASKPLVVSVITGVSIAQLKESLPGVSIVRAMPNTAIALCDSMTCISGDGESKESEKKVKEFFDQLGETIVINEELMGAATVVGACGIAFALRFMRAMSQGGIEIGFGAEVSQLITAQTIKGAARLILESNNHPEKEIDKVTTPMGVTISGLNEMEHQGFSSAVIKGLLTSFNKLDLMKTKKSE
ncbi:MAG: pyrroline-5-carboxylate reductase [Bacteroidota bacterium]|nr:MAG: pyrroline-5-carboxylate reductase [Bacteroidota bacterium]